LQLLHQLLEEHGLDCMLPSIPYTSWDPSLKITIFFYGYL
jgi:hypothetical protein